MGKFKGLWAMVRRLSGDDAYERYLQHYAEYHGGAHGLECAVPLNKAEFFRQWQDRKWSGIKRCC